MKTPAALLDRARLGLRIEGLFVFDAHMHLGEWLSFYRPACDAASAVQLMDRVGISAGSVSAIGAALGSDLRAGNDLVIAAAKEFPGRLFGAIVADPNDVEGMSAEIERCAAAGLRALKIHNAHGKPYDAPEYAPAFEIADRRSWPVLVHSGGDFAVLDRLAKQHRGVRWIFAHAADESAAQFGALARKHDNVFLDTAFSECPVGAVETLVRTAGVDRVLFGSDATFLSAAQQIGKILFARLSDDEKAAILGLNARRVFDLPETPA